MLTVTYHNSCSRQDAEGRTVLHAAALHKNVKVLKLVLSLAPHLVDVKDKNGTLKCEVNVVAQR